MPGLVTLSSLAHAAQESGSYLARAARMMVGVPDYGQYLAHMRREHPQEAPLNYEVFFKNRMQARYGGGRAGCC